MIAPCHHLERVTSVDSCFHSVLRYVTHLFEEAIVAKQQETDIWAGRFKEYIIITLLFYVCIEMVVWK